MATGGLRLWRLALKSIGVLSLVIVLLVFVARLSNNYVCLQIGQTAGFNGQGVGLLDINRDVYTPDTRTANAFFGQQSPDHKFVAATQYNLETRTQDLILRSTTSQQPQITLQSSFPGNGGNYGRGFARVAWSPDSQNLAYLWTDSDQNLNLSVVNTDGSQRKLVSLGRSDPSSQRTVMIDGWSADSQYLSVSQQTQSGSSDTVWSVADLNRALALFKTGAWSPQGHEFAGLRTSSDGDDEIVIWSPEQDIDTGNIVGADQAVQLVNWSPDGGYFAVQSHAVCTNLVYCAQRWRYDIFSSHDDLLSGDIEGQVLANPSTGPTGVWSTDGQKWIFLQPSDKNSIESDLVAWNSADNEIHTIADNLVNGLTSEMFYTTSGRRYYGATAIPAVYNQPEGKRLIIPTERNGKIKIELADLDGSNRTTLVDNADQILAPQQSAYSAQQFWSGDGGLVTIVWATVEGNNRQVHLTWAKADGSDHHEISDDIENIESVQLMRPGSLGSQQWMSYLALRNGVYGIEMAELDTGQHYRLFSGAQQNDSWSIVPSGDGNTVALVLQSYASTFFQNQLYLVTLDGKAPRQISADMLGLPSWSPDGSEVAYFEQDSTRTNSYVKLARFDGTPIKTLPIGSSESLAFARFNRNQAAVYSWTTCS